jgi:cytochrome d ubiquinol oxidase subunit I
VDIVLLSRLRLAVTIGFHYIYPPLSIGLGVLCLGSAGAPGVR